MADRTRPRKPGRWGWRLKLWKLERLWRDLMPVVALALAFYAVAHVEGKADKATVRLEQQAGGRRIAINVLCGGVAGVAEGGRKAIRGSLLGTPSPPPPPAEARLRDKAAQAYVRILSIAIIRQAGVEGSRVLRKDGTVDCERLQRLALTRRP